MPAPQIQNPGGVFGLSSMAGYDGDDRSPVTEMFLASTTITNGDLVALSTSTGVVIAASTGAGGQTVIGVARETISTAGQPIEIIVYGPAYSVKKDNSVAITASDIVGVSGAVASSVLAITAATVVTQAKDTGKVIGVAMASASAAATTADIFVVKF